ncbi:MAG TPA: exodeoxyribonuclease VII small subunit [Tenuifilaceae bacterium]|nr:exodeoxyribonuclease VII small subunit [Tenuifilaceae bacterium]HPE18175.1 exodeoxyribonuclease VII small subunit [Tenuifilaceae bacterium]HPJ46654.1 exodeoxyribonuclease VII small subunit [Tenuifilaceae bacterium]HPQ34563.1 exodeoxyribonuclease VII small subunit [Tenuifilaceae bacterium]HRX68328.1 exodeoxyribonuclease VII small subunit [Tenuifilaceae bacterium]
MAKKKITYSQAIEEIEDIIAQIENNEIEIDELPQNVSRVAELLKYCKAQLHSTEEEVEKLLKDFSE